MLNKSSIAILSSIFLQHICFLNAWIVPIQKYPSLRLLPERVVLKLSERSEDVNSKRTQLGNMFYEDKALSRKLNKVVHVVGLFESLNTVPVEEWVGYNDIELEEGFWMNMCRDDDCEQCAIPEDFKDPSITLDVLDFLGIRRVEPLHVKKTEEQ